MLAFVRANKLNRIDLLGRPATRRSASSPSARAYLDVRQALDELGIDEVKCQRPRPAPLQDRLPLAARAGATSWSSRAASISSSWSRRSARSSKCRCARSSTAPPTSPICIGKKDEQGNWLFPVKGALDPNDIAICIGERLLKYRAQRRTRRARRAPQGSAARRSPRPRTSRCARPYFCSGCPHNSSTVVPEGMPRLCRHRLPLHGAVDGPQRPTASPRWAARARNWIGEAPFSTRSHVFQNLGDGTYNHSGSLALRAAIAAGRQHHLQDPVQRRRRHDRRPAQRRRPDGPTDRPPGGGRRRQARSSSSPTSRDKYPPGTNGRRASPSIIATSSMRCSASSPTIPGMHRADLRPDLRRRKAPPPQARHVSRSRQARHHQRARLRGLRRLRRRSRTACRCSRSRPNSAASADRPVELQQGFLLRRRASARPS